MTSRDSSRKAASRPALDFAELRGAATGVGSLPFRSPERAVRWAVTRYREVPFWPQLPRRSAAESMLRQFRHPLGADNASTLEPFVREMRGRFALAVKGQVTGPITLWLASGGSTTLVAARRESARAARELTRTLSALGPPVIVFVDEPALHMLRLRSVREESHAEAALRQVVATIQRLGGRAGIHTCGPPPIGALLRASPDFLGLDFLRYRERLVRAGPARELRKFVGAGGAFAFGIVPTSMPAGFAPDRVARFLVRDLESALGNRGLVADLVKRSLITPACGTGTRRVEDERAAAAALRAIQTCLRRWLRRQERAERIDRASAQ